MTTTEQKIYNLGLWLLRPNTLEMMWDGLPDYAVNILDDVLEATGTMELARDGENQFGIATVKLEYAPDVAETLKTIGMRKWMEADLKLRRRQWIKRHGKGG